MIAILSSPTYELLVEKKSIKSIQAMDQLVFVNKGHSFERDDEEEKGEKHKTRFLSLVFSLSRDGKYLFLDAYDIFHTILLNKF